MLLALTGSHKMSLGDDLSTRIFTMKWRGETCYLTYFFLHTDRGGSALMKFFAVYTRNNAHDWIIAWESSVYFMCNDLIDNGKIRLDRKQRDWNQSKGSMAFFFSWSIKSNVRINPAHPVRKLAPVKAEPSIGRFYNCTVKKVFGKTSVGHPLADIATESLYRLVWSSRVLCARNVCDK